jgi:hypothetical protein
MKILSTSFLVLFLIIAVIVAQAVSIPSAYDIHQRARLDRINRRRAANNKNHKLTSARTAGTQQCIDDISAAAGQIGGAVVEVIRAVGDCPKQGNTDQCIADIGKVASYLTEAATDISQAVTDCSNGGAGSQCATDLTQLGHDVTNAAADVAQALADCKVQNDEGCIVELDQAAKNVEAIFTQIKKALVDCK